MPHTVSTLLRLRPSTGPRQQERANQPAAASRSVMVREAMVAISPPGFAVPRSARVIPRIIVLGIELRRSFEPLDRVRIIQGVQRGLGMDFRRLAGLISLGNTNPS